MSRLSFRRNSDPTKQTSFSTIAMIVVIIVSILALVVGGTFLKKSGEQQGAWKLNGKVPNNLTVEYVGDDGIGDYISFKTKDKPDNIMDLFEDPSCPYCEEFYQKHQDTVDEKVKNGDTEFNVHMLTFLDDKSGTTYSDDSASVLIELAKAGDAKNAWRAYHEMWKKQPAQGTKHEDVPTLEDMKKSLRNAKDEVPTQVFEALDKEPDHPGERAYQSNITNVDALQKTTNHINTPTLFMNGDEQQFELGDDEHFRSLFK